MTCLIEKTRRSRVKGDGPRRHEMVTFAKIGEVSMDIVNKLNKVADQRQGNDLGGDNYNISQLCNVDEVFMSTENYRQILIQEKDTDEETVDERVYTRYNTDVDVPFFNQIYRLRISEMQPGHEMNWHIDTDTSVLCRAQICLNENDSIFQFNRKGDIRQFEMKVGEVWFINTGWLHRVKSGLIARRSAIFGFEYKDYTGNVNLLTD